MSTWRGADIAKAFGVVDQGLVLNGAFCLNTPFGLATPSLYRGDLNFLQWLGLELPQIITRLGRLGLSRLIQAPTGDYYAKIDDEYVLLSTLETGPSCDPRNAFELFTVAAGLAHVHQQSLGIDVGRTPDWLTYYQSQRDKLEQLRPANLPRRALVAWSYLEETWRLCVEEAANLLDSLKGKPQAACLTLGLQSFADFVYLADRHQVHYNSVADCHVDSPAIDIARLLAAAGGEIRVANNILLAYQRVRPLSPHEGKELLAHLWFPHEVDLSLLTDQSANPLSLQRACNSLRDKIGMISELEDILSPPAEEIEVLREKEVLAVSKKRVNAPDVAENPSMDCAAEPTLLVPEPEATDSEIVASGQVENPPVTIEETGSPEEGEQQIVETELPRIHMEAITNKRATVWGPFPRPLGAVAAPAELVSDQQEQPVSVEVTEPVLEAESEDGSEPR